MAASQLDDIRFLVDEIELAFAKVKFPGSDMIVSSGERDEPVETRRAFRDKVDWRVLDSGFLDSAPNGYASSLSFLTTEGFKFYIAAFMIADLKGELALVDPTSHLCPYVDDLITSGDRLDLDVLFDDDRCWRLRSFDAKQCEAISRYICKVNSRMPDCSEHLTRWSGLWNARGVRKRENRFNVT